MIGKYLSLALLAAASAGSAQAPPARSQASSQVTLEQRLQLRCSAAFAMVAFGQDKGDAEALAFPPIGARGREYFVRASVSVMDEAGLDREAISAVLSQEARDIHEQRSLADVMQACLPLLPPE